MTRISDLTEVNQVSGGDLFPIDQGASGRTRSVSFQVMKDNISAEVNTAVEEAVEAAERAEEAAASADANVLRADLATEGDPLKGAELVGYESGTVANKLGELDAFSADVQDQSDPAKGAAIVGYVSDSSGAEGRTVSGKLRERLSILDYCTQAQRDDILSNAGAVDVSDAWQKAFDAVSPNGRIDCVGGTHLVSSAVSMSGKSRVRLIGNGATVRESSPSISSLISFTSCPRLRVEDLHFIGTEDYSYFQANSPTERRRFLVVTSSDRVRIKDVTGENKRGHIYLDSCSAGIVEGSDFVGFFQNVSLGAQANANECTTVEFRGGRNNKAVRCHAENHGSCVLWGNTGIGHSATDCTGRNLHDNGVYGSSGNRGRAMFCDFSETVGSSVKLRGSQNIAIGNSSNGALTGAAFSITGNGAQDAYGANGYGNICVANSAWNSGADGIGYGLQDGYYARDSVIALNSLGQMTSAGGFGGLRGALRQGGVVALNSISEVACDYGILSGASAIDPQVSAVLFGNSITSFSGGQQPIRVIYTAGSTVSGNVGDASVLIQARFVTGSVFNGNANPSGAASVSASAANSNSSNVVTANRGSVSVDGATHLVASNFPAGTQSPVASTPPALGVTSISGGQSYVSVGTGSPADWKRTDNI